MSWVVVPSHLSIKVGNYHVGSTSLGQGFVGSIAANGVIAVYNSLAIFIETSHEVEGVVREKPATVESLRKQMSNGFGGRHSLHFVVIDFQLGLEDLTKRVSTLVS